MCTERAQSVYRVCTERAQSVYRVCTECVQSVYRARSECVQSVYRVCTECVQSVYRARSECVQSVYRVCCAFTYFLGLLYQSARRMKNKMKVNKSAIINLSKYEGDCVGLNTIECSCFVTSSCEGEHNDN